MYAKSAILKNRYEVIVVGAGIGGLATACVLAHEGVEVLLMEQSHQPGGCCSSFRAGDFTFDAAASIFQGFGHVGFHVVRSLFDFLNQQVELMPQDTAYRMYLGDHKIDFHLDIHAFQAELGATFPQQAGAIISFMRELGHIYNAVLECGGPRKPASDESLMHGALTFAGHPLSAFLLSRHERQAAMQLFNRHVDDAGAASLFNADLIFSTGYDMNELASPYAAMAFMERHTGGTHYPIGSSQQIPDRLEKSLIEHGGRVIYRAPVREITVDGGMATGVILEDGTQITARAVVSDATARNLFGRLIRPEHLKIQTLDWLSGLEPARGVLAVYLGVRESVVPEDICTNTLILENPELDPGQYTSISIPSTRDPNLSPEGHHVVCIHSVTDPGLWPSPSDDLYGSGEYHTLKDAEAQKAIDKAGELLPGLSSAIVEKRVASPTTFERYTGRESGTAAGPRAGGMLVPLNLPGAVTEIKGVFMTGDSTFYGTGVAASAASGINCAHATLRFLGRRSARFHQKTESFVLETVPMRPEITRTAVVDTVSAVLESHRCMRCEDAPCRLGCPAAVDIPNFIRRISAADFTGAAQLIRESTPLGEICGLICPVEELCQARCRRAEIDTPVKIGELEALACSFAAGPEGWPLISGDSGRKKVAVVGSGPAGISCAFYLSQFGYEVAIFEAGLEAGGLPSRIIPGVRLTPETMSRELSGVARSGIRFRGSTSFGQDVDFESLSADGFAAVFLGTGLTGMRSPEIDGVELPGVIDSHAFLGSARRGVKRELSQRVAVIGGNNLAVDSALLAREMGAETVYLVTDKPKKSLSSTAGSIEAAGKRGVKFLTETIVERIVGEGRVEGIKKRKSQNPEEEKPKAARLLKVETVIIAGEPEVDRTLAEYMAGHVQLNPDGTVAVDAETLMTSLPGVFAGGDLVSGGELVVTACANGRRAAASIDRYLRSGAKPSPDMGAS